MSENVSRPRIVKLDLKQCPFCASQDVHAMAVEVALEKQPTWALSRPEYRHQEYVIACGNCGARGPNEPLVGKVRLDDRSTTITVADGCLVIFDFN